MKIGNIHIDRFPVLLAPMEDVTDQLFRSVCKPFAPDIMYTEFVSSDALFRKDKHALRKYRITEVDKPIGIQIYGSDLDRMVGAAELVAEENPNIIDINFGCPVKKIAKRGAGCGMMKDVPTLLKIVREVVNHVNIPVTVKTRLRWDEKTTALKDFAEQLQDCGIHALTVHGRTGAQRYEGDADWRMISEIKNNPRIHIPIIGNGDITSPEKAKEYKEQYGVDGVMIGRGAIGSPWIFKQVHDYLSTGHYKKWNKQQIIDFAIEHLKISVENRGEPTGTLMMRRHLVQYLKELEGFESIKLPLLTSFSLNEMIDLMKQLSQLE